MGNINFKIQNKDFYVPDDFSTLDSFEVNSVPRPYLVKWDETKDPCDFIKALMTENENNLLLIDQNVYNLYCQNLNIPESKIYKAEATEEFKTLDGVVSVIEFLEKNKFTKGETLVVVGGGIIQDIGAFVGACYKRGIKWIFLPTTLLSMCDSCIGGKTGINHNKAKNQLALFSAPSSVCINPNFLKTLNPREIKSGLGEIIKLFVTGGREFVDKYIKLVKNGSVADFSSFKPLIMGALSVKKAIVEEDEFELDLRRSLNYGHTVGHAVEVLSDYKIPHGQAVAIGMVVVDKLSTNRSRLPENERQLIKQTAIDLLDSDIMQNISVDGMENLLKKDKKTIGNAVNFVIIDSIGDMKFLKEQLDTDLLAEIQKIIKEEF